MRSVVKVNCSYKWVKMLLVEDGKVFIGKALWALFKELQVEIFAVRIRADKPAGKPVLVKVNAITFVAL